MIIDLDSHLREGYFMDEVYNLPEPYARFTPQKAGEGGNYNTKWVHQLDRGDPSFQLKMPPSEYVKRNCYVTCEADEGDMSQSLKEFGEDHILMATDYPHFDSEFPHTVSGIRERTDLTAKQKDKILGENAAQLLNL